MPNRYVTEFIFLFLAYLSVHIFIYQRYTVNRSFLKHIDYCNRQRQKLDKKSQAGNRNNRGTRRRSLLQLCDVDARRRIIRLPQRVRLLPLLDPWRVRPRK